jgi:hypothetical protein
MRANIQTQALPGSNMQAEYPLCARFSGGVKKVQQLQPSPVRARSKDVQPLLVQLHDPGMYLGMLCHTTSGMICHLRSIHIISNPLLLSIHIIRRLWHESHTYHPYALYLGWPAGLIGMPYIQLYPAAGVPPQPNCLRKRVW